MDEKTLEALRGSIRKWEGIVAGTVEDGGSYNCPLCVKFFNGMCAGCPVYEVTGERACRGSPYIDFVKEGTQENAQRELDFLRSLLPPEAGDA